jgi:hypothetical protein
MVLDHRSGEDPALAASSKSTPKISRIKGGPKLPPRSLNFGTLFLENWNAINLVAANVTFLTQPV